MSESDTMFNERDRRCAAVQLMLSTDPSYDNRTIASTLKMQIWIATNNRDVPRVMKTKFPATVMVFGVVSSEGHIMPPHIFEVDLKVNTKVYLDKNYCLFIIYIRIVIYRLFRCISGVRHEDDSSWDRNPPNFTSDLVSNRSAISVTYIGNYNGFLLTFVYLHFCAIGT